MASVPKSFLRNFLQNKKGTTRPAPSAKTTSAAQANSRARAKAKNRATWSRRHAKKSKGLFRSLLGAVAGEVLKGSGHLGKHIVKKISEDAMGSGGVPTNCASSGAISGLGAPGSDEPGVKKKAKNRSPMLTYKMFKRTKGLKV